MCRHQLRSKRRQGTDLSDRNSVPLSKEDKVKNQYQSSRAGWRCLTPVCVCSHQWDPTQLLSIPPGCWSDGREGLGVLMKGSWRW